MPVWARYRMLLEHATNSTFARATQLANLQTFNSQDEVVLQATIEAATGGVTFELGNFTTINCMFLENLDTTNFILAQFFTLRGTQADTVTFAQAATGDTITDDSAAGTMITNGSRAGSYVRITDAATAANNATFLIRSTTTNVITLVATNTVTADAADVVGLSFEERNEVRLAAAASSEVSMLYVPGRVVPEQDLLLTSGAGTPACRITILGT